MVQLIFHPPKNEKVAKIDNSYLTKPNIGGLKHGS